MIDLTKTSVVYDMLSRSGMKVYPLVVPEKSVLPFIVYTRTGVGQDSDNKDNNTFTASYSVVIVSKTYAESLSRAQSVIDELKDCEITGMSESFENDAFVQTIEFDIEF